MVKTSQKVAFLLLTLLMGIATAKNIDLGYVGKHEIQYINISDLFDGDISATDKITIQNYEEYPNLITLDEETKESS
jgi:hypothetical protein